MRVLAWNLEFASPKQARSQAVLDIINSELPEIFILSEVHLGLLPDGHILAGTQDWGARKIQGRRKIALVSDHPWTETKQPEIRPLWGRYVSGTTKSSLGPVRVIGICIPWFAAHVSTGLKDRRNWEEHMNFLQALSDQIIAEKAYGLPLLIAGGFNQALPRHRAKRMAYNLLCDVFQGFDIPTRDHSVPGHSARLLNHVALDGFSGQLKKSWPGHDAAGQRLSDHAGVSLEISLLRG